MKRRMKNAPEANLWILSENNKRKSKDDKHTAVMHQGRSVGAWTDIHHICLKMDGSLIFFSQLCLVFVRTYIQKCLCAVM